MARPQQYREVDVPESFAEWDKNAQINYLCGCLNREQMANYVREQCGVEERDKPLFRKDELAEIAVAVVNSQ